MNRYFSLMPHVVLGVSYSLLTGCVQARIEAYYHPKPPEPCQVPVYVDGAPVMCVSREHAQQILKDLTE